MSSRWLKLGGIALVVLVLLAAGAIALLDYNLRNNLAHIVSEKTGRELAIKGGLDWKLSWPRAHLHAADVTFANPSWAHEKQMLSAAGVDLSIDLLRLLDGKILLPDVVLERPVVAFERGKDGRANWLFDDKGGESRIWIGRLTIDHAQIGYEDPARNTSIVSEVSTRNAAAANEDSTVVFNAKGQYLGLPLAASGTGGSVLALRDDSVPYPVSFEATIGPTFLKGDGTVKGLVAQSAADLKLTFRGKNLAELLTLFHIAMPDTRAYEVTGHFVRDDKSWRYEKFAGRIGQSDVAGSFNMSHATTPRLLRGDVAFKALHLGDLAPVIGESVPAESPATGRGRKTKLQGTRAAGHILPSVPFRRDHWRTVDADVQFKAQTILRPKAVPLENLTTRLRMHDAVLTLEPLDFAAAGGHLDGTIRLDARQAPIQAHAKLKVRNLQLAKLLPTVSLAQGSVGHLEGEIELVGQGDSVDKMLAGADGKIGLILSGGRVSKQLMQKLTMHVPEIVLQQMQPDELVDVRCGVADFDVDHGVMKAQALVVDTDIVKIVGSGSADLTSETLNLTLVPKTKRPSLIALRGPIYVRGQLSHPDVAVDAAQAGGRGLAAAALAMINPLLSLAALADPGGARDSNCAALMQKAQAPWQKSAVAHNGATAEKHVAEDTRPNAPVTR